MAKNDFQYGGWNSYTLQCGMWLWNRDSEFTKWQHPAMKSPSYRSSIDIVALNCLVFEKIAFFCILATDRTDRRTNRWTAPMH